MLEAEYEHECCRAELLGLPRPTWDEFLTQRKANQEGENRDDMEEEQIHEEVVTATREESEATRLEGLRRMAGGLDELNSILQNTQKKLNRFKSVCGSFTNLLKIQTTTKKDEVQANNETEITNIENVDNKYENQSDEAQDKKNATVSPSSQKLRSGSDIDRLDSLINKAERAELSLNKQNKQMKKFLN
ncbi:hypothetical protein RUM43_011561 [Polyplax serrata]|uniref:Uncharacterized protein n=1 Tax=Polyplax serrata TaxID=468196 RepID=A0AAN8S0D4_POLSC